MTGIFAKGYGPHDWKKQAFGIDLFDDARWLEKIRATKNDLEFYDVMSEWVAQLNDAHDAYVNPSNFIAQLSFWVDIYDGKLLVDSIDRTRLPPGEYPISNGYELISIDGEDATKILDRLTRYVMSANTRSTRRTAAELVTVRPQWYIPTASSAPEMSTVVFRRPDGQTETYRMKWFRSGTPLTTVGKFPGYRPAAKEKAASRLRFSTEEGDELANQAAYIEAVDRLLTFKVERDRAVLNYGSLTPVFARSLPSNFLQRLGRSTTDPFFSGTFQAGGYRIGLIRIPSFSPTDLNGALQVFVREIGFFQENTDGLIIDIMRNPGGSSGYANALMAYLMFYKWRSMGVEVRATSGWVVDMSATLESLRAQGAPPVLLQGFEDALEAMIEANRSNRGLTRPLPWDFNPGLEREALTNQQGRLVAYTKAVLVLTDEFSASAADGFAGMMQDNGRAPLFGWRTMGAGGNVVADWAGPYSGGQVSFTQSLMSRAYERAEAGGYPVSRYVENVGVHPEYQVDYMTRDNLIQNGKPFVDAFIATMIEHIGRNQ